MLKKFLKSVFISLLVLEAMSCGGGGSSDEDDTAYYTVSFFNNGEVYNTQTVKSGTHAQRPDNPEEDEESRFVGWYENPNFTKKNFLSVNL